MVVVVVVVVVVVMVVVVVVEVVVVVALLVFTVDCEIMKDDVEFSVHLKGSFESVSICYLI